MACLVWFAAPLNIIGDTRNPVPSLCFGHRQNNPPLADAILGDDLTKIAEIVRYFSPAYKYKHHPN